MNLAITEAFFDDRVCTFTDYEDLSFGRADHHGHSLSRGIEFNQVEKLIFTDTVPSITHHIVIFVSLPEEEA